MSFWIRSWPVVEHMKVYSRLSTTPRPLRSSAAKRVTEPTSTTPAMFVPQWQT